MSASAVEPGAGAAVANPLLRSEITCPHCGHRSIETMPTDACQYFHDCRGCGKLLRPKPGDCCVFCSYGTVPCPPIQLQGDGAGDGCCGPARTGNG
ncbi:MAG: GDCCVxC domain-containing (seleno)protein [Pseudomonadota bacterium]|nr:GDCCVxC domain-containing (seleno)protein [Pseudomonadota bacterium]